MQEETVAFGSDNVTLPDISLFLSRLGSPSWANLSRLARGREGPQERAGWCRLLSEAALGQ